MAHSVCVNPEEIAARRRLIVAEWQHGQKAPPPGFEQAASGGSQEPPGDPLQEWREAVRWGVGIVHQYAAPGWELSEPGGSMLVDALAEIGHRYIPGGPDFTRLEQLLERLGPWGKLAAACGMLAAANFDIQRMRLKPMRAPDEAEPAEGDQAPAAERPAEAKRTADGRFGI